LQLDLSTIIGAMVYYYLLLYYAMLYLWILLSLLIALYGGILFEGSVSSYCSDCVAVGLIYACIVKYMVKKKWLCVFCIGYSLCM
jgi:hypothetical protein